MDRTERLLSRASRTGRILEIGPGYNPLAPKAGGWNAHVVDHTDRGGLLAKFRGWGVGTERVEAVDTVWRSGPLHAAIPTALHGEFDALVASHVLEDIPDPVGFLASAAILCRPGAAIALALSDHRFCFDYFQPGTTAGHILQAHLQRRARPGFAAVWNHLAYAVRLDGQLVASQAPVTRAGLVERFAAAAERYARSRDGTGADHHDAHGWAFTPAGFALVMLELGRLGVVDWRIDELHPTQGCEFLAFLMRGTPPEEEAEAFQRRRLDLLTQRLRERQEQVAFFAALVPMVASLAEAQAQLAAMLADQARRLSLLEQARGTLAGGAP